MAANILLWFLLGYLIWRLLRMTMGIQTRVCIQVRPTNKVDGLLFPSDFGKLQKMPDNGFLALAKARFVQITSAYASGQLEYVKQFVSPKVYHVFDDVIRQRRANGHHLEFKLVDFKKVALSHPKDEKSYWIDFATEQVNFIKDKTGHVIEGDPMYISTVHEKWQFTWDDKLGWLLTSIQTLDTHAV